MTSFTINGRPVSVDAEPDAPLLWVIREHLKIICDLKPIRAESY